MAASLSLPLAAGTSYNGQTFSLDVGGVVRSFTLDARGKSPKARDTLSLSKPGKNGNARYMVKLSKDDFVALLQDEGLTNATLSGENRSVPVFLLFNSRLYTVAQPQVYTAVKDKSGKTAQPRK